MSDLKATLAETLVAALREQLEVDHVDGGLTFLRQGNGTVAIDTDALAAALLGLSGVAVTALPDLETQFVIDYDYRSDSGPRLVGPFPSRSAAEEHADSLRGPGWEALYCISPVAAAVVSEGETR